MTAIRSSCAKAVCRLTAGLLIAGCSDAPPPNHLPATVAPATQEAEAAAPPGTIPPPDQAGRPGVPTELSREQCAERVDLAVLGIESSCAIPAEELLALRPRCPHEDLRKKIDQIVVSYYLCDELDILDPDQLLDEEALRERAAIARKYGAKDRELQAYLQRYLLPLKVELTRADEGAPDTQDRLPVLEARVLRVGAKEGVTVEILDGLPSIALEILKPFEGPSGDDSVRFVPASSTASEHPPRRRLTISEAEGDHRERIDLGSTVRRANDDVTGMLLMFSSFQPAEDIGSFDLTRTGKHRVRAYFVPVHNKIPIASNWLEFTVGPSTGD